MNIEIQFLIGAGCLSAGALVVALAALLRSRGHRNQLELEAEKVDLLEDSLTELRDLLNSSTTAVTEHSRRIAWLDAEIRRSRYVTVNKKTNRKPSTEKKSKINEQRNRVLTLAARGQDPGTIAATLGMMPGEVELMLSLNNHATALA